MLVVEAKQTLTAHRQSVLRYNVAQGVQASLCTQQATTFASARRTLHQTAPGKRGRTPTPRSLRHTRPTAAPWWRTAACHLRKAGGRRPNKAAPRAWSCCRACCRRAGSHQSRCQRTCGVSLVPWQARRACSSIYDVRIVRERGRACIPAPVRLAVMPEHRHSTAPPHLAPECMHCAEHASIPRKILTVECAPRRRARASAGCCLTAANGAWCSAAALQVVRRAAGNPRFARTNDALDAALHRGKLCHEWGVCVR